MTRRARLWTTVAGLAALILVSGVCLGWWAWTTLHRPHKGYPQVDIVHEVLPGQDAGTILRDLESRGVLSNAFLTRLYLVRVLGDPPLRAGEYRFEMLLAPTWSQILVQELELWSQQAGVLFLSVVPSMGLHVIRGDSGRHRQFSWGSGLLGGLECKEVVGELLDLLIRERHRDVHPHVQGA